MGLWEALQFDPHLLKNIQHLFFHLHAESPGIWQRASGLSRNSRSRTWKTQRGSLAWENTFRMWKLRLIFILQLLPFAPAILSFHPAITPQAWRAYMPFIPKYTMCYVSTHYTAAPLISLLIKPGCSGYTACLRVIPWSGPLTFVSGHGGTTVLHVQHNYKQGRLFQAWHFEIQACHHHWSQQLCVGEKGPWSGNGDRRTLTTSSNQMINGVKCTVTDPGSVLVLPTKWYAAGLKVWEQQ